MWLLLAVAMVLALAGCAEEKADNAVEATEQNTVALAGVDYRIVRFRQLNPRIPLTAQSSPDCRRRPRGRRTTRRS